jgi:hypothetical protein
MGDEVSVTVPVELMRRIEVSLTQCAQDLSSELSDRYPEERRSQSPTEARRWANDMETVDLAYDALSTIRNQSWYNYSD